MLRPSQARDTCSGCCGRSGGARLGAADASSLPTQRGGAAPRFSCRMRSSSSSCSSLSASASCETAPRISSEGASSSDSDTAIPPRNACDRRRRGGARGEEEDVSEEGAEVVLSGAEVVSEEEEVVGGAAAALSGAAVASGGKPGSLDSVRTNISPSVSLNVFSVSFTESLTTSRRPSRSSYRGAAFWNSMLPTSSTTASPPSPWGTRTPTSVTTKCTSGVQRASGRSRRRYSRPSCSADE